MGFLIAYIGGYFVAKKIRWLWIGLLLCVVIGVVASYANALVFLAILKHGDVIEVPGVMASRLMSGLIWYTIAALVAFVLTRTSSKSASTSDKLARKALLLVAAMTILASLASYDESYRAVQAAKQPSNPASDLGIMSDYGNQK